MPLFCHNFVATYQANIPCTIHRKVSKNLYERNCMKNRKYFMEKNQGLAWGLSINENTRVQKCHASVPLSKKKLCYS